MSNGPEDIAKARRARNLVLGGILVFLVLLFYGITIARMA